MGCFPENERIPLKLIIQIPCHNEAKTLPETLRDLPRSIPGIESIEILVIDDGSTDGTPDIARNLGVHHVLSLGQNKGLAKTFSEGLDQCLKLGADFVVNTDADNQYVGADIPKLLQPILEGRAEVVIGTRPFRQNPEFSWLKKKTIEYGSLLVSRLSRIQVEDAVSGFRAYSREAAMRLNTLTNFSYTLDNLIQLGHQRVNVATVPIRTNPKLRQSRLFKNPFVFLFRQCSSLIRVYCTYRGPAVFTRISLIVMAPGIFGCLRFLYLYVTESGRGHVQSLILSATLIIVGFLMLLLGMLAEMVSNNRKLLEVLLFKMKKLELDSRNQKPSQG